MLVGIWDSGEREREKPTYRCLTIHLNVFGCGRSCWCVRGIQTRVPFYVWISFAVAQAKYTRINAIQAVVHLCECIASAYEQFSIRLSMGFSLHFHHTRCVRSRVSLVNSENLNNNGIFHIHISDGKYCCRYTSENHATTSFQLDVQCSWFDVTVV